MHTSKTDVPAPTISKAQAREHAESARHLLQLPFTLCFFCFGPFDVKSTSVKARSRSCRSRGGDRLLWCRGHCRCRKHFEKVPLSSAIDFYLD